MLQTTNYKTRARSSRVRSSRGRHGQAIVEMALVVTVLLFLTLGLIQYGLIANARLTMTNLAREGARYAAVNWSVTNSDTAIKNYVIQVSDTTPLRDLVATQVTISPASTSRSSGQPITVTITYNLRSKFILPTTFPGLSSIGTSTTTSAIMVME